jgi:hypothetical protein
MGHGVRLQASGALAATYVFVPQVLLGGIIGAF